MIARPLSLCVLVALSSQLVGCVGSTDSESNADTASDTASAGTSGRDSDTDVDTGEDGYPPEPHGIELGDVFGIWTWVREDASTFSTEELYNIPQRVIVLYATAAWCGTCRGEVEDQLTPTFAEMAADVLPVGVLFEDALSNDATDQTALGYNSPGNTFEFVADTERDFDDIFSGEQTIPRVLVIDSRDMRIVYKHAGHDTDALLAAVSELAQGD